MKEDTVMGIVFSGMFGFGLVIFTKVETDQHLHHILFGNVLGVTVRDLVETAIIAGGTLLVVLLKRRDLLLYCFDPNHARAIGLPVARAPLRSADPALADHRRRAQGGRHHPRDRDAGGARRDRLSADRQLRAHAGDRDRRRHRVVRARHHRELPHRRCDRRLHRADPDRGVRAGVPVRAEARPGFEAGVAMQARGGRRPRRSCRVEIEVDGLESAVAGVVSISPALSGGAP